MDTQQEPKKITHLSQVYEDPFAESEKRVFLSKVFFDSREVKRLTERTLAGLKNYSDFPDGEKIVVGITKHMVAVLQNATTIFNWAENYVSIEHYDFLADELHDLFEISFSMHNEVSASKVIQQELAVKYSAVKNDPYLSGRIDLNKKNIHALTSAILMQKGKTPSLTGDVPAHVRRKQEAKGK